MHRSERDCPRQQECACGHAGLPTVKNTLMNALQSVKTVNDLELLIEQLSQEIERKCGYGPLSFRDAQQLAASLTQMQLLLNELERIEAKDSGAHRENAGRFCELARRIRQMRSALSEE